MIKQLNCLLLIDRSLNKMFHGMLRRRPSSVHCSYQILGGVPAKIYKVVVSP